MIYISRLALSSHSRVLDALINFMGLAQPVHGNQITIDINNLVNIAFRPKGIIKKNCIVFIYSVCALTVAYKIVVIVYRRRHQQRRILVDLCSNW